MKCRRRIPVQARLPSFPFLLALAFHISILGQQPVGPVEQTVAPPHASESILLPVTVTDEKGIAIGGLDKSAFTIYEGKVPQEITFFSSEDQPVSIGIIVDLSGSLAGSKRIKAAWNYALRFVELSHSDNAYFVIAFASETRVLVDWTRGSKTVAERLSRYELTSKKIPEKARNTSLYDACYLGIEKMKGSSHTKQAILLITDGQDNESRYTFSEVRQSLRDRRVLLYSIGVLGGNDPGSSLGMEGQSVLDEFSAISGGRAYFPQNIEEIKQVFDLIAQELRRQYMVGFRPSKDIADGKWHKIKVKVTPPLTSKGRKQTIYVRSREGYFAVKALR